MTDTVDRTQPPRLGWRVDAGRRPRFADVLGAAPAVRRSAHRVVPRPIADRRRRTRRRSASASA